MRIVKPAGVEPWDADPTTFGYKGGDLLGIVEHLDYIQELGVNALYLNPIFQSASNHRYHTHDYFHVDPLLGGDAAFDELLEACHARGIRVVLDGVFNHASRGFFQFNDVLENGESSPWRDWFTFNGFPANAYDHAQPAGYNAWYNLHALPKFNTDNPEVREFIMQVGEYWLRKGIDGWRLDVPHEITTAGFWQEFRQRTRAINSECYITGEIWDLATEFLEGDQFDSVMNYRFTEAVLAFVGRGRIVKEHQEDRGYNPWPGITGTEYADRIDHLLGVYDWNVTNAMMNLIDSHDTPRALTLMSEDVRSLELAYLLLLTYPGAPSIYYGSEIGLDGGMPDKWARKTFPWDHQERWNSDLLNKVKELVGLRSRHQALRTGTYQTVAVSETSHAFVRESDDAFVLIVANTGDTPEELELNLPGTAELLVGVGEKSVSPSIIPARSGSVWRFNIG
ncbi:MAG: glycoside hydrolase family 13 protein [Thermomicrobiales bacterium]|nr:glycoside hydrolase family 13 protein [Thermomicrobiales bacterium]